MRLKFDDPNLASIFLAHCEDGWSARSFIGKGYLSEFGFNKAIKENAEFRVVYLDIKSKQKKPTIYKGLTHAEKRRRKSINGIPVKSAREIKRSPPGFDKPTL